MLFGEESCTAKNNIEKNSAVDLKVDDQVLTTDVENRKAKNVTSNNTPNFLCAPSNTKNALKKYTNSSACSFCTST